LNVVFTGYFLFIFDYMESFAEEKFKLKSNYLSTGRS